MKRIIFLVALLGTFATCFGQLPTTRTYPGNTLLANRLNTQSFTQVAPTLYHGYASASVVTNDTLKGVDTAVALWHFNAPYDTKFTVKTVQKADSLSGVIFFYASEDNVTWLNVTGLTTVCTSCIGASKTVTLATGTNTYTIDVGNTNFPYWKALITSSRSTDTTAVSAVAIVAGTGN